MFSFIKNKLQKIFNHFTSRITSFFNKPTIDAAALQELETILISSDVGVSTTRSIIKNLKEKVGNSSIDSATLKKELHHNLINVLSTTTTQVSPETNIFLFVGINGSGKTTTIGKLASLYAQRNKKVLLVAGDTFRAAACEQLNEWAILTGADIVRGNPGQDPASVVYAGCDTFKKDQYDILIIDTAGRLQTKINLMNELAKIKKTVIKQLPDAHISTLLTIDSMLGQNSFEQAKLFKESTDVNGIVLTKMDGTGKGGIIFSIVQELSIPITFLTFGEKADNIKEFNAQEYVTELLG